MLVFLLLRDVNTIVLVYNAIKIIKIKHFNSIALSDLIALILIPNCI